uniref:Uncharacterized protein n=1 Tax=Oncorhynchus mykiss TaxID=8022 RepID=A0A8C7PW82_ONCMY
MFLMDVFFSFGLCIAFLGPTILYLQCQTVYTESDHLGVLLPIEAQGVHQTIWE